MNTTELTPVESSNIAAAGYDADALTLRVRFVSGDEYVYIGVTEDVGQAFFEAESVGRYFNANIRHAYTFGKIDLDAEAPAESEEDAAPEPVLTNGDMGLQVPVSDEEAAEIDASVAEGTVEE